MDKVQLQINDFPLFFETIQNMVKISGNLKITVNKQGFTSWVADANEIVRLDVSSNAVCLDQKGSEESVDICTKTLQMLSQLLMKINKAHMSKLKKGCEPDFSDVDIRVDDLMIYIKSSTLKTSIYLDNENAVHVLRPFTHTLHPIAEVSASIEDLKDVLSSSAIFKQPDKITIEVCHQDDMIRNVAYAFMSDPNDPRTNDMVTKFGNIISGDFTRNILIDIPRMKFITTFPVESLKFTFNQEPCFFAEFSSMSNDCTCRTDYRLISKYVLHRQVTAQ